MPSDPSGVHPKGVLSRAAADFFDDHMATGGATYENDPPVGKSYASISLYNDANTGIALKVYGVTAGNDSLGVSFAYMRNGPPLGTFQGECRNVRPDLGAPFGAIYMRVDLVATVTALYPLALPPAPTIIGGPDAAAATVFAPFPIFIIPVGWSLVIANTDTCSTVWAGFWYQQANE